VLHGASAPIELSNAQAGFVDRIALDR